MHNSSEFLARRISHNSRSSEYLTIVLKCSFLAWACEFDDQFVKTEQSLRITVKSEKKQSADYLDINQRRPSSRRGPQNRHFNCDTHLTCSSRSTSNWVIQYSLVLPKSLKTVFQPGSGNKLKRRALKSNKLKCYITKYDS